jgi:hypothetical protein
MAVAIIYFVWIAGWIVSSLVYVILVRKSSAETGEASSWLSIFTRVLLLGIFWPILLLAMPLVFRGSGRSKPENNGRQK